MCRKLIYLIGFVFVLSLAGYASAADINALIPSAAAPPVIDGIKEDLWSVSAEHRILNVSVPDAGTPPPPADLSASWWALWDTDYLYVFYDVNDDELYNDSLESYKDDTAEIFIDIGNDDLTSYGEDDYQWFIPWNADSNVKDIESNQGRRGLAGVEYIIFETDDGYTLEIKIPWTTLDYLDRGISLGDEIGFEAQIDDDDDGDDRERAMSWFNTENIAWEDPSTFGTVKLAAGLKACNPTPQNGAEGVLEGLLEWTAGIFAKSHDVYFGTDPTPDAGEFQDNVTGTEYAVTIDPNTTYYWRIDEVNEEGPDPCFWEGDICEFTSAPLTAHHPDPCDGAQLVDLDADLSWGVGFKAQKHKVYFDLSEAKVEARSGCEVNGANCVDPCYPLSRLDTGETYHWAVDEVNDSDPCVWPGDVWNFTTVPVQGLGSILYEVWLNIGGSAVENLTSDLDYPDHPDTTGYATLFEDPFHPPQEYGTRMHGWLYVWDSDYYTFWIAADDSGELWLSTDDSSANAALIAFTSGWSGSSREWDRDPEQQSNPIYLQAGNLYYIKSLHKALWNPNPVAVGWSTTTDPNDAEVIEGKRYLVPYLQLTSFKPDPADRLTDVQSSPTLMWTTGVHAATHDVYFGTDKAAVTDANRTYDPCGVLVRQDLPSVHPITTYDELGMQKFNTTYYWRIDDVNGTDIWPGTVWSFTVGSYHAVENLESYENTNEMDDVWSISGSAISLEEDKDIVHNGEGKSMKYDYTNDTPPYYSEAYADTNGQDSLDFGLDWRLKDVKALSLWFQGQGIPDLRGDFNNVNGTYTIEADGRGISGKADYCYFVYRQANSSSGVVTARVVSVENTDQAKAGVMMRDSLDPDSKFAAVVVTPEEGVALWYREDDGDTTKKTVVSDITAPHWVKIQRTQQMGPALIKAYHADDVNGLPAEPWEKIGGDMFEPEMSSPMYLGLCLTSSSYGSMCEAKISDVEMKKGSPLVDVADPCDHKNIGCIYNDPAKMYVVLEDSSDSNGIVYYTDDNNNIDPNATQIGEWTEWRIDLNDFNDQGVVLTDVNKMYIGFGDRDDPCEGGLGEMYIDDIRLYLAEFYKPEFGPWATDIVRNGEIDYDDIRVIADNWLISDYNLTPVAPPDSNLIAWYKLEQDADDSANGFHGEPCGVDYVNVTDEYPISDGGSWALDLAGDANYIVTDYNTVDYGIDGNKPRTITAWVYTRSFNSGGIYEIGEQENGQDFSLRTMDEPNQWRVQYWGGPTEWGAEEWDTDFTYPSQDTWVHFAHTYNGTTTVIYVDGYARAEAERVSDINTTTSKTFSIGIWWDNYFDGIIDDVRIYNIALSQANAAYIARYPDGNEFTQPLSPLLTPTDPNINLYVDRPQYPNNIINLKDIAELGKEWGDTQIWPNW